MPTYAWKVLTLEGKLLNGVSRASDVNSLEAALAQSGHALIKASEVRNIFLFAAKGIGREQLLSFSFQLSLLLKSGITILDALSDIAKGEDQPAMHSVIDQLEDALRGGKTLSAAMATQPKIFDSIYINLIHAGEQTGRLPFVLENITEMLKWRYAMVRQTQKALIYPLTVLVVIAGMLIFMLAYVVPKIAILLNTMQIDLPWQTQALIWLSQQLVENWAGWLALGVGLFATAFLVQMTPHSLRSRLDLFKLKLPILGSLLKQIALARLTYVLALLYAAGITITEALVIVEKTVGNQTMAQAVQDARHQINQGKSLSAAFASNAIFPSMVISMLRIGETSGSLDLSLKNVSELYTQQAQEAIETLEANLQPFMTIVLGGIMATVMVFTLGPLYLSVIGSGSI